MTKGTYQQWKALRSLTVSNMTETENGNFKVELVEMPDTWFPVKATEFMKKIFSDFTSGKTVSITGE